MAVTPADTRFLAAALKLAERGLNTTTPNPRVGCLIVRDGRVIARGWHERAGGPHAEAMALLGATEPVAGATCYVSLEPCAHHGRTPPCANALIEARIGRVVAAMTDPDPRVGGRGFAALRAAGIQVDIDDTPEVVAAARALNAGFCSRLERGQPWVRLKIAASIDGRTAMASGESQWITGEAARADVQLWRARSCAVMTGSGTVLADDPRLTVRTSTGEVRQPLRVVLDSNLAVPATATIFSQPGNVLIATTTRALGHERAHPVATDRVEWFATPGVRVDVRALFAALAARPVNEVLVEAGPKLTGHLLQQQLWDEAIVYLAPKWLGSTARASAEMRIDRLSEALEGRIMDTRQIGDDLRVTLSRA